MYNVFEHIATAAALNPDADGWAGTKTSDRINMGRGRTAGFIVIEGTGTTGTTVITITASQNAGGTGAEAIPFKYRTKSLDGSSVSDWIQATASGFTTAAGGDQIIEISVRAEEMPAGKPWLGLVGTEGVDAATDVAVLAIMGELRHQQEKPDAITA